MTLPFFKGRNNPCRAVALAFRTKCGKSSVEPNLEAELTRRNKMLATLFEANIQDFKFKPKKKKSSDSDSETEPIETVSVEPGPDGLIDIKRPMVNCLSARDIAEVLFIARGLKPEDVLIKCGIDSGQGSLKVKKRPN